MLSMTTPSTIQIVQMWILLSRTSWKVIRLWESTIQLFIQATFGFWGSIYASLRLMWIELSSLRWVPTRWRTSSTRASSWIQCSRISSGDFRSHQSTTSISVFGSRRTRSFLQSQQLSRCCICCSNFWHLNRTLPFGMASQTFKASRWDLSIYRWECQLWSCSTC